MTNHCRYCDKLVPEGRRIYCSDECYYAQYHQMSEIDRAYFKAFQSMTKTEIRQMVKELIKEMEDT